MNECYPMPLKIEQQMIIFGRSTCTCVLSNGYFCVQSGLRSSNSVWIYCTKTVNYCFDLMLVFLYTQKLKLTRVISLTWIQVYISVSYCNLPSETCLFGNKKKQAHTHTRVLWKRKMSVLFFHVSKTYFLFL